MNFLRFKKPSHQTIQDGDYLHFAWLPTHVGYRKSRPFWIWMGWYIARPHLDGEASFVMDEPIGDLDLWPHFEYEGVSGVRMYDASLKRYFKKSADAWDLTPRDVLVMDILEKTKQLLPEEEERVLDAMIKVGI